METILLIGQRSGEVFLDVGVHHWTEVVVFTVPQKIDNKYLVLKNRTAKANKT